MNTDLMQGLVKTTLALTLVCGGLVLFVHLIG